MSDAGRDLHIIVADDEPHIVRLIRVVCSRLPGNVEVTEATDGSEVPLLAGRQRPDLILLDIKMPGLGGFEVLDLLKSSETTQDIPVVVMTGLDTLDTQRRVEATDGCELLPKPLDIHRIRSLIQRYTRSP